MSKDPERDPAPDGAEADTLDDAQLDEVAGGVMPGDNVSVMPGDNVSVMPGDNVSVMPGDNVQVGLRRIRRGPVDDM